MNDVANMCIASGGRPIMSEAVSEFEAIISKVDGLVLNIGTADELRFEKLHQAHRIAKALDKPLLLDPVGCSASQFRLSHSLKLLKDGGVSILKCNGQEAKALLDEEVSSVFYGVDSQAMNPEQVKILAYSLWKKYEPLNKKIVVIITGATDYIVSDDGCDEVTGGSILQQSITGTGCMLNSLLMTRFCGSYGRHYSLMKVLECMKRSSECAARRIHNQGHLGSYKQGLIDEVATRNRPIYLITQESANAQEFKSLCLLKTEVALQSGIGYVQYRVKNKSWEEKIQESQELQGLARKYGTTFIINDDIALAKTIGADGVHLGAQDMTVGEARKELGSRCVIGATAKTLDQARQAVVEGADYLGVGALFPSLTKPDAIPMDLSTLESIYKNMSLPLYGIGGITPNNLTFEHTRYLDGVAMVSSLYQEKTENISTMIHQIKQSF
jgi:thiamine-phosphate diphosphorylase/hydroxyethylthiazole kinase